MQYRSGEKFFIFIILLIIVGLPLAIKAYSRYRVEHEMPPHDRFYVLSASAEQGWHVGQVSAWQTLMNQIQDKPMQSAVMTVNKGDRVVLQLTSNDVVHGFSMKDFGIFVNEGIAPGKPVVISFVADRAGEFTFVCNFICGTDHETMKGVFRVRA